MLIVIKCFTCNKTLADKYNYYIREIDTLKKEAKGKQAAAPSDAAVAAAKDSIYFDAVKTGPILDKMGLTRYCCRRHMLGTVDMMEII
jgi:DNA-directed RNA polymerase subunit N (RpoN/RPB10)